LLTPRFRSVRSIRSCRGDFGGVCSCFLVSFVVPLDVVGSSISSCFSFTFRFVFLLLVLRSILPLCFSSFLGRSVRFPHRIRMVRSVSGEEERRRTRLLICETRFISLFSMAQSLSLSLPKQKGGRRS
jgi:hypothetical protein